MKVDAASGLKVEVGDMVQSGAEIGIEPDTEKPLVSPVAGVIKGIAFNSDEHIFEVLLQRD